MVKEYSDLFKVGDEFHKKHLKILVFKCFHYFFIYYLLFKLVYIILKLSLNGVLSVFYEMC